MEPGRRLRQKFLSNQHIDNERVREVLERSEQISRRCTQTIEAANDLVENRSKQILGSTAQVENKYDQFVQVV